MDPSYWKQYWEKNRERILRARRMRYHADPEYRADAIERARRRYWRNRKYRKAGDREESVAGGRKPRLYLKKDGTVGWAHCSAEAARRCGISPAVLSLWDKKRVIPVATVVEKGRRWYSEEYIEALRRLVEIHWNGVGGLEEFAVLIKKEFEAKGIR